MASSSMDDLWSTFQQQLQTNTQASLESRMLRIEHCRTLQNLPDLIGKFSHLEELIIYDSLEKTDTTSLVQSLKQLSNLRSLVLSEAEGDFFSGTLDLSKGRDSTNLDSSTSSRMDSLDTVTLDSLQHISKLVISREMCPRLRSLFVDQMYNLKEMDLKQLEKLNILNVWECYELETISGLSSLTGLHSLHVENCPKLETISGLSSLTELHSLSLEGCPKLQTITGLRVFKINAHLHLLERLSISGCPELQRIEEVEELPGLERLVIQMPADGYAWVRDYIYRLKRLSVKKTILAQKAMRGASSKLNANLFSKVIGAQAVSEIESGGEDTTLKSSLSAITIFALLVTASGAGINFDGQADNESYCGLPGQGDQLITVLLTQHDGEVRLKYARIKKGFKVTVEVGEALTVLQRIVDQLYG